MRAGKEFVVRAHSFEGVTLAADDAWFSAASPRAGCSTSRTRTSGSGRSSRTSTSGTRRSSRRRDERVASQNWHVDFDDKHLLKAFVYLVGRRPGAGAVRVRARAASPAAATTRSARGCRWATAASTTRTSRRSVPPEEIATLHRPEGDAHPLQHERPPPRRLRDGRPAGARDGDLLLARVAEGALEPQLHDAARGRRDRPGRPLRRLVGLSARIGSRRRRSSSSSRAAAGRRRGADP